MSTISIDTLRRSLIVPAALAVLVAGAIAAPASAQDAMAQDAMAQGGPEMTEPSAELGQQVEDFFHYGKLGRYDLAVVRGQEILDSQPDPTSLLAAFRTAARERNDNLDNWLAIWQGVENQEMSEMTGELVGVINQGRRNIASDPAYIREQIERLSTTQIGYQKGMQNLRNSGELAVPLMLSDLNDPNKRRQHPAIRQGLRDLGRRALAPLIAATEAEDPNMLTEVVTALGDIGYPDAAPYVQKVASRQGVPAGVQQAAERALNQLGVSGDMAQNFYSLAESLYYERSAIAADNRYPEANVWAWRDGQLMADRVPPAIYNEVLSMEASSNALAAGSGQDEALSLWLAANYKRAAELPADGTDTTRPENDPGPQYYGVTAGPPYTATALRRALGDGDAAVALAAIQSLQSTLGDSSLGSGDEAASLIDAMSYADRRVRFESALALGGALPTSSFSGSEQVVPLLGEALSQTGSPSVVVVAPSQDRANVLAENLSGQGYQVETATSAASAIETSRSLAAVDAVVIVDELPQGEVDRLFDFLGANRKTAGAARVMITASRANRFEQNMANNPLVSTTTATEGPTLGGAVEQGRRQAGSLPLDGDLATDYALRAGEALGAIADSSAGVYDISAAKSALIGALDDERQAVQLLAADVLGSLDDADAQVALLQAAGEESADGQTRIGMYQALAKNARNFGNRLGDSGVSTLREAVTSEQNLDIRTAAAEAYGALSLPSEQAKTLIVQQLN